MEHWKDIIGYEGFYQASNLGNIMNKRTGRILKLHQDRKGYMVCCLSKNGKQRVKKVHRLVAEAFIPNNNLPQINHKDESKSNNRVENLEWCTNLYNAHYKDKVKRTGIAHEKAITQFTLEGDYIRSWDSARKAADALNIQNSHISECCKGKLNKTGGYIWKYSNEVI